MIILAFGAVYKRDGCTLAILFLYPKSYILWSVREEEIKYIYKYRPEAYFLVHYSMNNAAPQLKAQNTSSRYIFLSSDHPTSSVSRRGKTTRRAFARN